MICTTEINANIVISLLKQHNIKIVIASPGATNVAFIGSIQNDPFFTLYSAVDKRSAAYMACGLAEEAGEPVVISCTGATASRNYLPGLTEAYYRKLPILAITSTQSISKIGHLEAQVIDRSQIPKDVAKLSVTLPIVKDKDDVWECETKVNMALLELLKDGGGPVHINLPTTYSKFKETGHKVYRQIKRFQSGDKLPKLEGRIAIFIGSHKRMNQSEMDIIDSFCECNNAVVFCDHTSHYHGKYRLLFSLVASQEFLQKDEFKPDILIHIGEVSGDYPSLSITGNKTWRVSLDGELKDKYKNLENIFQMDEMDFFRSYIEKNTGSNNSYFLKCNSILTNMRSNIPTLPFSNVWVASQLAPQLPSNSVLHLGILNSLRSWNYFDVDKSIRCYSNVGGFGIDGIISSLLGASLVNIENIYFCVLGDLAFFYDMNTLGSRHINSNIRILVVNNGVGTEFNQYNHHAAQFGKDTDRFIAAAEHFGNKSTKLVKDYAENLGFRYFSAKNKEEFKARYLEFLDKNHTDKPIVFEVFTNSDEESNALNLINTIEKNNANRTKHIIKKAIKKSKLGKLF